MISFVSKFQLPYVRHYNPRFVFFLPQFSLRFIFESGLYCREVSIYMILFSSKFATKNRIGKYILLTKYYLPIIFFTYLLTTFVKGKIHTFWEGHKIFNLSGQTDHISAILLNCPIFFIHGQAQWVHLWCIWYLVY